MNESQQLLEKALKAIVLTYDYVQPVCPLYAKEGWEWYEAGMAITDAIPHSEWSGQFLLRVAAQRDGDRA